MPGQFQEQRKNTELGFSFIELIIVVLIISIISILALLSFKAEKKYSADIQAYQIYDVLQEARQRSLTQRETMRVEINRTRNVIRLISENEPGDASDDQEIKSVKLEDASNLVVAAAPQNITSSPVEMSPTPVLSFRTSVHPLSLSETVATLRFVKTGRVLDAGSNSIGDNSSMTGATIYIWSPDYSASDQPLPTGSIIRAITVEGTSGMCRYWKCPIVNGTCEKWIQ